MGVIYLLYNEEGRGYIGKAKHFKHRLEKHKAPSEMSNSKLLGEFKYEILEECENDCLDDFEGYWYKFYNELFPQMLVNGNTPNQSIKEWKEKNIIDLREKRKINQRKYRLNKKLNSLII
jgi:hypothetical protein